MFRQDDQLNHRSYYEATALRDAAKPALQGRITTDVCVVGGGLAGLSAALELAQRGYSVALLEARRIGWGASGRNGGQIIAGYACDNDVFEQALGAEGAQTAWQMSIEAIQLIRQRIDTYQIDCDFTPGHLTVSTRPKKTDALRAGFELLSQRYHYPHLTFIEPGQIRDWIDSPRYHAAIFDSQSGHLHPLKYTLGLAAAAEGHGVQLFEHSPVTHLQGGEPATISTSQGAVQARFVVLAGNVYLGKLAPSIESRIMPVGTYIIATEPLTPAQADTLIKDRVAVCDNNFVLDYFRTTRDHRMLFGGRVSYSTLTPANLPEVMRGNMLQTFPQLHDTPVAYCWGGFVDISMNRAPDFGRLTPNIYYLQGFSGHGLAVAGLAGRLATEAIAGQAERFDLMARIRHRPFPGGKLLRTPALVLGMWYYGLRDRL
ncbi:gamma-glutamylputrescine oxidase [Chitinivorax tropicus]|uniref:Gamma-glutamylputrescine oxidase n=2 Tax=Chitinivorax tropicus TaxID=714531 RepID=A0A840MNA0_9PROT|nr:gamma-glutamylputrescine oxidase [Chitinivorax tropicus]